VENKASKWCSLAERTSTDGKPQQHNSGCQFPTATNSALRPHLEYVSLPSHLSAAEGGGSWHLTYFPNRGLVSLVVVMEGRKDRGSRRSGKEGFTGTPSAVGLSSSPLHAVVQIAGDGFRVEVGALQITLESTPHRN